MFGTLKKIFGNSNDKALLRMKGIVKKINEIESKYQSDLKDEDIINKTAEFKERIKNGESVDAILPEAFALAKNVCRRLCSDSWEVLGKKIEWNMIPFDEQLIGAITLHEGNIAEMKTGEGKTLVATLPLYLNALTGKSCYLVTANEYLAERDANWMKGVYNFLGLTVGVIKNQQSIAEKKQAYSCDIIYGTSSEFGFDYLRDNMATNQNEIVQKFLHYAIVDEVDSILIDEARTPLIISAPDSRSSSDYTKYAKIVNQLEETIHYTIDEKATSVSLNEDGIDAIEKLLNVKNLYDDESFGDTHLIEQALKAKAIFKKDQNYVVKDGEVIIVDEFTGRLMNGRRYSEGLHQAIEAKEGVPIRKESRTLATITLQNYFRLFEKLAGMTGTALTEAEEFNAIYGLDVLVIPTHIPVQRNDLPDAIYKSKKGKYDAIAKKVSELYEKGQPVLIGTVSIEQSEILHTLLSKTRIPHNVLNAKQHEKEAEIISKAGQKHAVTIATNMAGRGTDIKLGENIQALGGLFVIGTERHESRRIDNQLRGRSGRQGDPGTSQFYISVEDDLMRMFGGDQVKSLMERLGVAEDMPIENRFITNSIQGAQRKVEGHHFDIRKHLVEYDDVINKHREIIYKKRKLFLTSENVKNDILLMMENEAEDLVLQNTTTNDNSKWNYANILNGLNIIYKDDLAPISEETLREFATKDEVIEFIKTYLWEQYARKEKEVPDEKLMRHIETTVGLKMIDMLWMEHIDAMTGLREKVAFAGYAQKNPLLEYKNEAFVMFENLLKTIRKNTLTHLFRIKIEYKPQPPAIVENELATVQSKALTQQEPHELAISKKSEIQISEPKAITKADSKYLPKKKKKK